MATVKDIDMLLEGFVKRGLPGCSLKVMQRGNTLYEGYFGYTDLSGDTPVTKDTLFRQASMSKIPLYTAMMLLYQRGKFLLTDPVGNYLPEWKESKKYVRHPNGYVEIVPTRAPITIRDTLSMKCGLPYCNSDAPTEDITLRGMQECMRPLWAKGHYTLQEPFSCRETRSAWWRSMLWTERDNMSRGRISLTKNICPGRKTRRDGPGFFPMWKTTLT